MDSTSIKRAPSYCRMRWHGHRREVDSAFLIVIITFYWTNRAHSAFVFRSFACNTCCITGASYCFAHTDLISQSPRYDITCERASIYVTRNNLECVQKLPTGIGVIENYYPITKRFPTDASMLLWCPVATISFRDCIENSFEEKKPILSMRIRRFDSLVVRIQ
jgi:hypothetical protein